MFVWACECMCVFICYVSPPNLLPDRNERTLSTQRIQSKFGLLVFPGNTATHGRKPFSLPFIHSLVTHLICGCRAHAPAAPACVFGCHVHDTYSLFTKIIIEKCV